jgi:two-component system, LuxR family, response regulator FixJ
MDGMATVFIADDVPDILTALARLLTAHYRVRLFKSAEQFLEKQDGAEADCLLLDIGLPGLTGIELQRSLFGVPDAPNRFPHGNGRYPSQRQCHKGGRQSTF